MTWYSIGNGAESGHCIKMDTFGIHRVSCISGDSASYGYLVISSKYFPLYEITPVCPKPSYWMYLEGVNSSKNSRGNGRPMLDRFVLDKCHLRMSYMICGFQRFLEACILHDVFDKCQ